MGYSSEKKEVGPEKHHGPVSAGRNSPPIHSSVTPHLAPGPAGCYLTAPPLPKVGALFIVHPPSWTEVGPAGPTQ